MNVRTRLIWLLSVGTVVLAAACKNDWQRPAADDTNPSEGGESGSVGGSAGNGSSVGGSAGSSAGASSGGAAGASGSAGSEAAGSSGTAGMSGSAGTSSVDPNDPTRCSPGTWIRGCPCPGGEGFQQCNETGTGVGACQFCSASSPDTDGDGDANDTDNCPSIWNPDQTDTDNDGVGDVCDPTPNGDTPMPPDVDGDGFPAGVDCNDAFSAIFPGAVEVCDTVDNNCNGIVDEGCAQPVPAGLVLVTYQYTDTMSWNALSVFQQAMQAGTTNILPRIAPYAPPPEWGTAAYVIGFAYGIAADLPSGARCTAQNASAVSCSVHVPAGARMWANVDRTKPGGGGRACTAQYGVNGSFVVKDGRGNVIATQMLFRPSATYESCVWEYTAPLN